MSIDEYDTNTHTLVKTTDFQDDGIKIKTIDEFDKDTEDLVRITYYQTNGIKINRIEDYDKDTNKKVRTTFYHNDGNKIKFISEYDQDTGKKEVRRIFYQSNGQTIKYKKEFDKDTNRTNKIIYYQSDGIKIDRIEEYDKDTGELVNTISGENNKIIPPMEKKNDQDFKSINTHPAANNILNDSNQRDNNDRLKVNLNSQLTTYANQLQIVLVDNENKAKIIHPDFDGEVIVKFTVKEKLKNKLTITDLDVLDAKEIDKVKTKVLKRNHQLKTYKNHLQISLVDYEDKAKVTHPDLDGEVAVTFKIKPHVPKKPFLANVIMDDEIKNEFKHIFNYIEDYERYEDIGASIPKGYLLYGPPGTGKTYLCKELAKELGSDDDEIYLEQHSASEFLASHVGKSEKIVREMFENARKKTNLVLLLLMKLMVFYPAEQILVATPAAAVKFETVLLTSFYQT
ncbi:MAG: hypothetical protein AB2N28_4060 [Candidatus Phytoplasma solani]